MKYAINKDGYYEFQADVDLAIRDYFDSNKEFNLDECVKFISKATEVSERMIIRYLISEILITRYEYVKDKFKQKRKTDKDYDELCKAIEEKQGEK